MEITVQIFDKGPIINVDLEDKKPEINVNLVGTGPPGKPGQNGYTPIKGTDYWTKEDKKEIIDEVIKNIPEGNNYKIGSGLKLDESTKTISVDIIDKVEEDNTRPISSAAVYETVGNIEVLLETI